MELNVERAVLVGAAGEGHALVADLFEGIGGNNLEKRGSKRGEDGQGRKETNLSGLGLDDEGATVEVGDGELEAAEGVDEGNLLLHEEVGALADEEGMLLLLEDEDEVAGLGSGGLGEG